MAQVGIIMGSVSDLDVMKECFAILDEFGVSYEKKVISAHRTPLEMCEYASTARSRGLKVIVAGAGGAAHLPGMVASLTSLPVVGVPVMSKALKGIDSLLSIAQMPKGVCVATVGINQAFNASLLAIQILATNDENLAKKLDEYKQFMRKTVVEATI